MTFDELLEQIIALLRRDGRVTYRALKRRFALDDDYLADLTGEIIDAKRLAVDEEGKVLVWTGAAPVPSARLSVASSQSLVPSTQPLAPNTQNVNPGRWTPPHLAERIRAEQAAMEARGVSDGERKTITALFADIKDSTALIEDLDPEEARRLIDPALRLMMDAVHRYDGYVAQSLGDGIFALFGAPIAYEDHPQRALYAALRMQEDSRRYAEELLRQHGINLQIRVGINTGEVVVRSIRKDDLHTDYVPVGHSTNLASRMESLASGGAIVVSEHTHKLTEGFFEFKSLGAARIKGVSEPLPVYEVLGVGALRTRLQVAARRGLVRFVGRQPELEHLRRALTQAKEGRGQLVGVMGEPGVGKSRLFYEFKILAHAGCLILEAFSVSHEKAYPYLPLIDLLYGYFHITAQDDERRRREKVLGKVLALDRSLEDIVPYLSTLLGIAESEASLQQMDPQIRKRRTFEAIKRMLLRESLNQPLIVIFEDLHWIDAETQAFLSVLSESLASARLLLLVNYRPEYRQEWGHKSFFSQLRLDPLGQEEAEELLATLLGNDTTLQPLKRFILQKTEGNPFFMEEIVQALREQGLLAAGALGRSLLPTDLRLPPTVQGIIASRIDRLPAEEKALLQTVAVIGKEFPFSLVKQVANRRDEELQTALAHLQAAEFIYEQPAFPEPDYTFKHALTQEVAYNSLLIERRKALHEQTGQAIEALFHDRLEDHYGELAHHYSRSENTQKAIEYLQQAGQQAVQRSANAEGVSRLTTALDLLKALPDTRERIRRELTLQLTLGVALQAAKGFAAPEVETTYTRARALCQQVGETPQLFTALRGLWVFWHVRPNHHTARDLGEQMMTLAQRMRDPSLLMEAHHALGASLASLGESVSAQEHFDQALALYDPEQHRALAFSYGYDTGVVCYMRGSLNLWVLGYPDLALERIDKALQLAEENSQHPHTLAAALDSNCLLHTFRGEWQAVRESAEAMIALSSERGFSQFLALGDFRLGSVLVEQGQSEEGILRMHRGLSGWQATGAGRARPYLLSLLAEAYGKIGQREEGFSVLDEALAIADKNDERFHEAELYRLKGQLTLQSKVQSPDSQVEKGAEECFLKAIEIARLQQAKSLELRATMSLARLWQRQGKRREAHSLLSEIYGWFTEGFDTRDLQEAKALLEELAKKSDKTID